MRTSRQFRLKHLFLIIPLLLLINCDWPFNTNVTGDVFKVSVFHNIERVMPSDTLIVSWDEITVDGIFANYRIERRREQDTSWTFIAELPDRFQLSYIDTISDDENLFYRVGLFTEDGYVVWGTTDLIEIPNTDSIFIPTEFDTIMKAIRSPLIDENDIVLIEAGLYSGNIFILGKNIILKSIYGREETILNGNYEDIVIGMNNSTIDGFTIVNGSAKKKLGGGILINGDGIIQNCAIQNNFAEVRGGGVYINGDGCVYNTIFNNNFSPEGSGIFIKDGHGEIINNTFINSNIFIDGNCDSLLIRNNIIYQSNPDISFTDPSDQDSVIIDYSLFDVDLPFASNIIIENPQFIDNIVFQLSPTSPCIDAGHPNTQYLDNDGTRNDIGAYGGPIR